MTCSLSHDPVEAGASNNPNSNDGRITTESLLLNDCDAHVSCFLLDCCFAAILGFDAAVGPAHLRLSVRQDSMVKRPSCIRSTAFTTFLIERAQGESHVVKNEATLRGNALPEDCGSHEPSFSDSLTLGRWSPSVTPSPHELLGYMPSSIVLSAAKAPKDSQSTRFYATAATSGPGIPGPPTSVNQPNGKGTKPIRPQTERRFSISSWKIFGRSSSRHRDEV